MTDEKPLHVQVALALGYLFSNEDAPRFDTDWSAAGPLIEKYRIFLGPSYESGGQNRWHACLESGESCLFGEDSHGPNAEAATPLEAVCRLILKLKKARKLKKVRPPAATGAPSDPYA